MGAADSRVRRSRDSRRSTGDGRKVHMDGSLVREASASERAKRLAIERSTSALEAENSQVEAELQKAKSEIKLLKAKVTALALGGQLETASSDLKPLPRSLSEEEKVALLKNLTNVPIELTDDISAIVQEYCKDEEVDLSKLPMAALVRIKETVDALAKSRTKAVATTESIRNRNVEEQTDLDASMPYATASTEGDHVSAATAAETKRKEQKEGSVHHQVSGDLITTKPHENNSIESELTSNARFQSLHRVRHVSFLRYLRTAKH